MTSRLSSLAIDLLFLALSPLFLLALLVASRGFTLPKLRRGLWAKLGGGLPCREGSSPFLWVHTVSVGEVLTALPFIEALRGRFPECDVGVSVSTFTGFDLARERLGATPVFYFPLDVPFVVERFLRRLRPAAVILLELEVWPSFLLCARRRGVPVLVANGRITERSARRYRFGRGLTRRCFNLITSFGAQNEAYRERFLSLGVEPAKVEVLGNLKHDRGPSPAAARGAEMRARLGWPLEKTLVLTGGSTHAGEEKALCALHAALRPAEPQLRLVLAPRHVERLSAEEIARWGSSEPVVRWSEARGAIAARAVDPPGPGTLLVDTLGELEMFYAMADIVFVGGSLIPHGGHNLFEAARLQKAIITGPHYQNFQEEGDLLVAGRGAVLVAGEYELAAAVERLAKSPAEREDLAGNALAVTRRLGGATDRHLEWVERHLRLYLRSGA